MQPILAGYLPILVFIVIAGVIASAMTGGALLLVAFGEVADIDGVFRNFGRSVLGEAHKGMRQPFLDPFLRDAAVRHVHRLWRHG